MSKTTSNRITPAFGRDIEPIVALARRRATRLVSNHGLARVDIDDVAQDLLEALLHRQAKFDESRGTIFAFAGVIFSHRGAEILASALEQQKLFTPIPLAADQYTDQTEEDLLIAAPSVAAPAEAVIEVDLRNRLESALPIVGSENTSLLNALLSHDRASQACQALGMAQRTFCRRRRELQRRFRMAGFTR